MNKQELINKLRNDLTAMSEIKGKKYEYDKGYERAIKEHLAMITALDWPEKPVVPQYVADFYESIKDDFEDGVYDLFVEFYEDESELSTELYWWFKLDVNKPIETLVKMKLYGYEVEKEKLYTVEIPNQNGFIRLVLCKGCDGKLFVATFSGGIFWQKFEKCKLTESEIKEDFDWAFRWAKEVEE